MQGKFLQRHAVSLCRQMHLERAHGKIPLARLSLHYVPLIGHLIITEFVGGTPHQQESLLKNSLLTKWDELTHNLIVEWYITHWEVLWCKISRISSRLRALCLFLYADTERTITLTSCYNTSIPPRQPTSLVVPHAYLES